jgi:hypothetical protein
MKQKQPLHTELGLFLSTFAFISVPVFALAQSGSLVNPLQFESIQDFLKGVLGAIMYIGLPVIALVIVYSGFMFITARGNPEKIKAAIYNFQWVVIGTGVFLGAWALTNIVAATINMLRS